jgi:hypothetical protein
MARIKNSERLADLEVRVGKLEERVAALEAKAVEKEIKKPWFLNLPKVSPEEDKMIAAAYEEGRKYRESLRPKARTPAKKKKAINLAQPPSTSKTKLAAKNK